jgi:alkylmercury lyase
MDARASDTLDPIALETIANQLVAQLDCTQDVACLQIMRSLADVGQPLAPTDLATRLQMSEDELATHLARVPDTEFDAQGNIVGWGITLVPTPHQFRLSQRRSQGRPARRLFTWCAFDTVLFPPLLQVEAQVQSVCEATGHPITFVATPQGVEQLSPATSVVSLIVPAERCDCVRGTFCHQSLFFQSEQAATFWMASHPEAISLSLEEAAWVGQAVARRWPGSASSSGQF